MDRDRDHVGVAGNIRSGKNLVAGMGNKVDAKANSDQVQRESETSSPQMRFGEALNKGNLEHSWQTENSAGGEAGFNKETQAQARRFCTFFGVGNDAGKTLVAA